jgi:hypothetical protein
MPSEFVGVRVTNLNALVRNLRKAGADMQELKDVNKRVADIVLPVALALTPTDGGKLKGTGRTAGTAREAIIRFGFARVPYAGVTHYGTPAGYVDAKGRAKHQEPQPWLAEAAASTEPQWIELYWTALMRTVESVAKS